MMRNSLIIVVLLLIAMTFTLFGCGDVQGRPIPLPVSPTTQGD